MSLDIIKSNARKMNLTSLVKFLLDVSVSNIEDLSAFNTNKTYTRDEIMYIKHNNIHKVLKCIVDMSTKGTFIENEWASLNYKKPSIIEGRCLVVKKEEFTKSALVDNTYSIKFKEYLDYQHKVNIYHPVKGKMVEGIDFLTNKYGKIYFLNSVVENYKYLVEIMSYTKKMTEKFITKESQYVNSSSIVIKDKDFTSNSSLVNISVGNELLIKGEDFTIDGKILSLIKTLPQGTLLHMTLSHSKELDIGITPVILRATDGTKYKIGIDNERQLYMVADTEGLESVDYIPLLSGSKKYKFGIDDVVYIDETTDVNLNYIDGIDIITDDQAHYKIKITNDELRLVRETLRRR